MEIDTFNPKDGAAGYRRFRIVSKDWLTGELQSGLFSGNHPSTAVAQLQLRALDGVHRNLALHSVTDTRDPGQEPDEALPGGFSMDDHGEGLVAALRVMATLAKSHPAMPDHLAKALGFLNLTVWGMVVDELDDATYDGDHHLMQEMLSVYFGTLEAEQDPVRAILQLTQWAIPLLTAGLRTEEDARALATTYQAQGLAGNLPGVIRQAFGTAASAGQPRVKPHISRDASTFDSWWEVAIL